MRRFAAAFEAFFMNESRNYRMFGRMYSLPDCQRAPPSALPGISPSRGENGWAHSCSSLANVAFGAIGRSESLSPLEGEMPGRAEGGAAISGSQLSHA